MRTNGLAVAGPDVASDDNYWLIAVIRLYDNMENNYVRLTERLYSWVWSYHGTFSAACDCGCCSTEAFYNDCSRVSIVYPASCDSGSNQRSRDNTGF
ncbi:MAG: hypothetical protein Hals2KO_01380 [Halioglobus sp.]